jgi:hypothetical protein
VTPDLDVQHEADSNLLSAWPSFNVDVLPGQIGYPIIRRLAAGGSDESEQSEKH